MMLEKKYKDKNTFNDEFSVHSTAHGVLRMVLEFDGELVERVDPILDCSTGEPKTNGIANIPTKSSLLR